MRFIALTVKPSCSRRATIAPAVFFSIASGLMIESVRSRAMGGPVRRKRRALQASRIPSWESAARRAARPAARPRSSSLPPRHTAPGCSPGRAPGCGSAASNPPARFPSRLSALSSRSRSRSISSLSQFRLARATHDCAIAIKLSQCAATPASAMPSHVLIVEDERDLQRVLTYNFRQAGFDVVSAGSEEQRRSARSRRSGSISSCST